MNLETVIRINRRVVPVTSIQGKTIYTTLGPVVPVGKGKARVVVRNPLTGRFARINVNID